MIFDKNSFIGEFFGISGYMGMIFRKLSVFMGLLSRNSSRFMGGTFTV